MPLMLHATITPENVGTIASGMWRRYVATAAFSSFLRWSPAIVSTMPPQIVTVAGPCIRPMNIAITDLCKMSNSRIDRLLNSLVSELPAFLNKNADFNNGLMMIQYASAGLQGELRILAHPAVVDNLTTCANQEDYVNMGYNAAKKAYDSMHLAKYILAAELICDGQALDCYEDKRCAKGTQAIYDLLRSKVPEMDNDMPLTPYLEAVAQQIIDRAYIRTVEASVGALKF